MLASFAIFQFLWVWNDLLVAMVFLGTEADQIVLTARLNALLGSRGFTADDIAEVIDLYLAGAVRVDHLTGRVRPLEEGNEALEDLAAGRVFRSVLVP